MSVSLEEVINSSGFVLSKVDDARWLLSKQDEWEELVELAEELVDKHERYNCFVDELEEDGVKEIPSFEEWRLSHE